jgi:hypothetical protein
MVITNKANTTYCLMTNNETDAIHPILVAEYNAKNLEMFLSKM